MHNQQRQPLSSEGCSLDLQRRDNFKRKFREIRVARSGLKVRCNVKVEQTNGAGRFSDVYEVHDILLCNDNWEQYNSTSLAGGEYKVYGIVCCRDNSQHYRRAYFSASSRAERVVCDKRHISTTSA